MINVSVDDGVTPFLNDVKVKFPRAYRIAMRMTAAHFTKLMKKQIGWKYGNDSKKKSLSPKLQRLLRERAKTDSFVAENIDKHIHPNKNRMSGMTGKYILKRTIRYSSVAGEKSKYETAKTAAYEFGFTGRNYKNGQPWGKSQTAMRMAEAIISGRYYDKKTRQYHTGITNGMKRYFKAMFGRYPNSINYTPNPMIDKFFDDNRRQIVSYFDKTLAKRIAKLQKESQKARAAS